MDEQQAGLWQMIMGMFGKGQQPPQPQQSIPPQGASTRDTVAAPNRKAYLTYAEEASAAGEQPVSYAAWLKSQQGR